MTVLQSLSWPSQTSMLPATAPLQLSAPAVQRRTPGRHTPTLLPHAGGQAPPAPPAQGKMSASSSTPPSQSSSRPLHTSGLQVGQPPGTSSFTPLQSSSAPLAGQASTAGTPAGASQRVPKPSAVHTRVPGRWQTPSCPLLQVAPLSGKSSSTRPSQSSSAPLHFSTRIESLMIAAIARDRLSGSSTTTA